jgi:EF-hand domain-containing family member B
MTDPYKRPDYVASNIRTAGVSFRAQNESVLDCLRP